MNIKDLPLHQRPREKLVEKGVENLKNKELLAILLRTGKSGKNAIELAEYILAKYPLQQLSRLSFKELTSIESIDIGKASTLLASFELAQRSLVSRESVPIISTPGEALVHLHFIRSRKKEHFVALYLNARNHLIHQEIISVGTLTASIVHPREVFEPAIRVCAGSILIAHNHPSGDTSPSDPDIRITKQLIAAGELLNIEVVDHIIVAEKDYISLKEKGYM
ncbi:DNA repair protein RadC [soil metagenome]